MSATTVREIAIEVSNEVIAAHDRYDTDDVDIEISDRLAERVSSDSTLLTEVCLGAARTARKSVERARYPHGRKDDGQLTMFSPEAIVVLGDKQRVMMGSMVINDLREWRSVLTRNYEGQSKAFFANASYIDAREAEWLQPKREKWSLFDLERQVFGY